MTSRIAAKSDVCAGQTHCPGPLADDERWLNMAICEPGVARVSHKDARMLAAGTLPACSREQRSIAETPGKSWT